MWRRPLALLLEKLSLLPECHRCLRAVNYFAGSSSALPSANDLHRRRAAACALVLESVNLLNRDEILLAAQLDRASTKAAPINRLVIAGFRLRQP
jgi:hypothetical protein